MITLIKIKGLQEVTAIRVKTTDVESRRRIEDEVMTF
jgi:hypothetical protein